MSLHIRFPPINYPSTQLYNSLFNSYKHTTTLNGYICDFMLSRTFSVSSTDNLFRRNFSVLYFKCHPVPNWNSPRLSRVHHVSLLLFSSSYRDVYKQVNLRIYTTRRREKSYFLFGFIIQLSFPLLIVYLSKWLLHYQHFNCKVLYRFVFILIYAIISTVITHK